MRLRLRKLGPLREGAVLSCSWPQRFCPCSVKQRLAGPARRGCPSNLSARLPRGSVGPLAAGGIAPRHAWRPLHPELGASVASGCGCHKACRRGCADGFGKRERRTGIDDRNESDREAGNGGSCCHDRCRLVGLEAGVWSRMGQIRAKRRPWSRRQRSKARASGVIPSPVVRARTTAQRLQCERRGYLQVAIRSARSPEAVVSFASMTHPSSMAMRHI